MSIIVEQRKQTYAMIAAEVLARPTTNLNTIARDLDCSMMLVRFAMRAHGLSRPKGRIPSKPRVPKPVPVSHDGCTCMKCLKLKTVAADQAVV
jgi:hypothetical protein